MVLLLRNCVVVVQSEDNDAKILNSLHTQLHDMSDIEWWFVFDNSDMPVESPLLRLSGFVQHCKHYPQ